MEQEILIKRDGLNLFGIWKTPEDRYDAAVIMFHGFAGAFEDGKGGVLNYIADKLVERKLAVLEIDFNGHGKSDGNFTNMNLFNEVCDGIAATEYVMEKTEIKSIYLLGHSQGGVIAGAMAGYYPDVVKKLVLMAPAASLVDDARKGTCMKVRYDTDHIPKVVDVNGRLVGGHLFRTAKSFPIYETAALYKNQALVVYGEKDFVVTKECIAKYGVAMPQAKIEIYDTLDHQFAGEETEQMISGILSFLGD